MTLPITALSPSVLEWSSGDGTEWRIELQEARILIRGPEGTIDIPKKRWGHDILFTPHDDRLIIRFETFERSASFVVSRDEAGPFLAHLRPPEPKPAEGERPDSAQREARGLLWPKVSPLGVYALICSSLTFLPIVGIAAGIVTVILLVLHRIKVRRSEAFRHSRILATVAFVLLIIGSLINGLGTWGWMRNLGERWLPITPQMRSADEVGQNQSPANRAVRIARLPVVESHRPMALCQAGGGASTLDKEHNWGLIVAALFVVLLSLTVHEAAHAISAWWLGDDFAKRLGRVTLNPLAHIDPFGTVVLPLLLYLMGAGLFGWAKPVPVRVDYVPRPRRAHILISVAGPGSNLLLAAGSLMALIGLGCAVSLFAPHATVSHFGMPRVDTVISASGFALAPVFGPLCTILQLSFLVNVFLAFFNLIPIPPLDGSWVLEHLFPRTLGPIYAYIRPFSFLLVLFLMYSKVLVYLLLPAAIVTGHGFQLLNMCTGL